MSQKKSFGFITDPLENFNREAETSLFIMRELFRRGHAIYSLEPKDLFLKQNDLWAATKRISLTDDPQNFYKIEEEKNLLVESLDILFLRKDPPFDLNYLYHLLFLLPLEQKVKMINAPSALLKYNEKLCALAFPFSPQTWTGSRLDLFCSWAAGFAEGVVVKTLNEAGGRDVYRVAKSELKTAKTEAIVKKISDGEQRPFMAQEFLPAIKNGDKRILLWDEKILGAFVRKPKEGEFRANLHLGGEFSACELTKRDLEIAAKVGAWAKKEKLPFVGFDLIGDYLTEINITSPMGIREINALYGKQIEKEIVDYAEALTA
ncbi:MAG: glutathione synthase [Deltaproteobacteria bacterium]|nr:glutathione synthase [Deltaproteobacteria bacterium]